MKSGFNSDKNQITHVPFVRKALIYAFSAFVLVLVGVIIASNLDFTPETNAEVPINIAQTGIYPVVERDGSLESPFVSVVEKIADAVVNISARSKGSVTPWWHSGSSYSTSSGSGFFFRDDGYILTNNHVVENAVELYVTTASGYRYEATLVGNDPQTDLAVVKIELEDEKIVSIKFGNSDEIKVGDWAIAIGNPFPQQGLDRTVTVGVISAKGRNNLNFGRETPTFQDYIQTDASINPGNSGGPLLNLRGEVVGVNAAISSPTGGSVGIGFAIPINMARSVVTDLITTGEVSRGWLGVWLGNLTEEEARRQGLDAVKGVKIDSVFSDSPADLAGIKRGDIILKVNDNEVNNNSQLSVQISQARKGQPIPIELIRNGNRMQVSTVIADREAFLTNLRGDDNRAQPDDFVSIGWMGMELITFTEDVAEALNIGHIEGIYVRRVALKSNSDKASINRGSIILQVDGQVVTDISDLERIVDDMPALTSRIPVIIVEPDGTLAKKVIRP